MSFFWWDTFMVPVLRRLYHVPMPNDQRDSPMEVLALGISRSGTESLKKALEILGYGPVYHGFSTGDRSDHLRAWYEAGVSKWEHDGLHPVLDQAYFDRILGHYRAVTDSPCAMFAPELIKAYPEAKVILNYRDTESWRKSAELTLEPLVYLPLLVIACSKVMFWQYQGFVTKGWKYQMAPGFQKFGRTAYRDHFYTIKGAVEPDNLLIWKIGDGWEPLCEFLDKPIPEEPFPYGNTKADWDDGWKNEHKVYQNMLLLRRVVNGVLATVTSIAGAFGIRYVLKHYYQLDSVWDFPRLFQL